MIHLTGGQEAGEEKGAYPEVPFLPSKCFDFIASPHANATSRWDAAPQAAEVKLSLGRPKPPQPWRFARRLVLILNGLRGK
jgi:hypothetical protein